MAEGRQTIALQSRDAGVIHVSSARCDVAVLVDKEVGERGASGRFIVDVGSMEAHVVRALRARHENVAVVPFDPAVVPTIDELRALKPRLVFNLTEWIDGDRRFDAAIASMLDMLKLTYTGAGAEGLQLARDKALAKGIVADLGIEVAAHRLVNGHAPAVPRIEFPIIVKPQFGDASDGIANAALVRTPAQLRRRLATIRRNVSGVMMCETFVPGRDLFVALLGNEPRVMPPLELIVRRAGAGAPKFATAKVKHDPGYRRRWGVRYRIARLDDDVRERIEDASRRVFRALKLRDYARVDYRLTSDNRLVFLEANPNPDLTRHTFGRDVCFAGVAYPDLIGAIVDAALARAA